MMAKPHIVLLILIMALTAWCSRDINDTKRQTGNQLAPALGQIPEHYTVLKGDTLIIISVRLGIPYQTLALWNDLQPPFLIKEGQILRLRPPKDSVRVFSTSVPKLAMSVLNVFKQSQTAKPAIKSDWQWPVRGRVLKFFDPENSKGLDLAVTLGQTVNAAASGKVVYAGDGILGHSNLLIIKHDEHWLTAYGNNRLLRVKLGDEVSRGQVIAEASDNEALPYLHFEIRNNGDPVNPLEYLPPP
ncbi:MAG: M23 family metallopeptidase [Methylococcaceae bacterium]|nr:M23 family metallopeptidase [Methylococcaceae bacterium]